MNSEASTHLALLDRLLAEIESVLGDCLRGAGRVALVNFPNHDNAGDPALWLGTRRVLRRLGVRVCYQCDHQSYDAVALAATRPEMILVNGGGNFGDLWKGQQQTRERLLADLPDVPTVQLSQSVSFSDPERLARMQRLVADHRDLTLLLRDPASLQAAREWFDAPSRACPDMALGLGPLSRAGEPTHDVLWLARADKESQGYTPDPDGLDAQVLDWLQPVAGEPSRPLAARTALRLNQRLTRQVRRQTAGNRWWRPLAATYPLLARARVDRGCRILARGRVVITDRLHGHILSLLQAIPHVALDTMQGKVGALYHAYTHDSPLAHWADTPEQAVATARELLA